ncbi:MAG: hypothetical protein ABR534_07250 [Desulfotignum sp.]
MATESMQGYTPNTIQRTVTPQIDRVETNPQNQQTPASDIDNTEQSGRTNQQAFQVDITQQARDRLAAAESGNTQNDDEQKAVFSETPPSGGPGAGRGIDIMV